MYHKLSMRFLPATSEFGCPGPRLISQDELKRNFPHLDSKFKWGVVVYDGEMDDSRLLIETMLTASQDGYVPGMKGASLLNYARLDKFVKDSSGKIIGVEVYDKVNRKTLVIKGKHIVNATGNFTDNVRRLDDPSVGYRVVHALGTHVMLDRSFCSRDMGILIPKTSDGRVLFCVPWLQGTTIGTTDVIMPDPVIHPTPTPSCIDFIKRETSEIFPIFKEQPFESCVRSKWAGIRPLVLKHDQEVKDASKTLSGKDISRSHVIIEANSGLISVVGGKWTTFRRMGEEVMTLILRRTDPTLKAIPKEKSTRNMRFIGDYRPGVAGQPLSLKGIKQHEQYIETFVQELNSKYGNLGLPLLNHLARSYGLRSFDILEMIAKNPQLGQRLHPRFDTTRAEIVYQIKNEMVVNVFDLLLRRNRLAFLDRKAAEDTMPMVIDLLGNELGWSEDQKIQNLASSREVFQKMEF